MKTYQCNCCVCNGNIFLHSGLRMEKHVQIDVHAFYAFETQTSQYDNLFALHTL